VDERPRVEHDPVPKAELTRERDRLGSCQAHEQRAASPGRARIQEPRQHRLEPSQGLGKRIRDKRRAITGDASLQLGKPVPDVDRRGTVSAGTNVDRQDARHVGHLKQIEQQLVVEAAHRELTFEHAFPFPGSKEEPS
jgi:hypothetical protein